MSEQVIKLLNEGRGRELTAIMQYMSQHYEVADAGYGKLADRLKKIALVEMGHAEALAERILFLGGQPSSKPDASVKKGQEIPALLATDKQLEQQAMDMYREASRVCAEEKDQVTRDLFDHILKEEEDHWNEFDVTQDHVEKMGAAYLATLTG